MVFYGGIKIGGEYLVDGLYMDVMGHIFAVLIMYGLVVSFRSKEE